MAYDYKGGGAMAGAGGGLGYGVGSAIGDLFAGSNYDDIRRILENLQAEAGPSAFGGITEDSALRGDQLSSLNALKSIADQKGMDVSSRVGLRQALDTANANERANRGAIVNNFAMRGMGGSGAELAAQLANEQGAAQRGSMAGAQAASDASRRALSAISGYGDMAGGIRGQDWNAAAQRASAQDAMARFNAGQRVTKAKMQTGMEEEDAQRKKDLGGGFGSFLGGAAGAALGFL